MAEAHLDYCGLLPELAHEGFLDQYAGQSNPFAVPLAEPAYLDYCRLSVVELCNFSILSPASSNLVEAGGEF